MYKSIDILLLFGLELLFGERLLFLCCLGILWVAVVTFLTQEDITDIIGVTDVADQWTWNPAAIAYTSIVILDSRFIELVPYRTLCMSKRIFSTINAVNMPRLLATRYTDRSAEIAWAASNTEIIHYQYIEILVLVLI